MKTDYLIAGMWGTTNLQLFLIEGGRLLEGRQGLGASKLRQGEFEPHLRDLIDDWASYAIKRDILLAGMVGSTIGWSETPYAACPYNMHGALKATRHQTDIGGLSIIHGLSTHNIFGEPDVMRGEELELFGLCELYPTLSRGRHLVCIPGTHTKWVVIENGVIESFVTSVAGEMFAGLLQNGVLASPPETSVAKISRDFGAAVEQVKDKPEALLHLLFSVRSRQVIGQVSDEHANSLDRLSGLIIGGDVAAILSRLTLNGSEDEVFIIGSDQVAERYATAIGLNGLQTVTVSSQDASVAGFWALSEAFTQ